LLQTHHITADNADAAPQALAAGVDYDLSDGSVYCTFLDQVQAFIRALQPQACTPSEIVEGIRGPVGNSAKGVYSEGCKITEGKQAWSAWYQNEVTLPDPASQMKSIQAAAEVARHADVASFVEGENESTNHEAWAENHLGDRRVAETCFTA